MDDLTTLVARTQAGDRVAADQLSACSRPYIFVYAVKLMGNVHDADTLTQDVQLHVLRKLSSLRDARRYKGWVRRIVLNMARNRKGRPRVVVTLAHLGWEPEALESHPDHRDEGAEADGRDEHRFHLERLGRALETLRPIHRQAIDGHYFEGRQVQDIAADCGVPEGTVKQRLHTARQRLREHMGALC